MVAQENMRQFARPTIRSRFYIIARSIKIRGFKTTVRHYVTRLTALASKTRATLPSSTASDFDSNIQLSVPEDLRIRSANARFGVHYNPSRESIFRGAIDSLPITFSDYDFIDLGAGKGEALLLAAGYGFKRVIGVEYSESLAAAASANLRNARELTANNVECIFGDATEFILPVNAAVIYLYNPFQARVMDRVLENIGKSLRAAPRDLWIVYVNPWEHRKFVRAKWLRTIVENWEVPEWGFCIYRSIT